MSDSPHTPVALEKATPASNLLVFDLLQRAYERVPLTGDRLLAAEAMMSLIRLDRELRESRAQFNEDWFRRVMRARSKAVSRLRRRWSMIGAKRPVSLGSLRRRYHANIAKYLYGS